ncbi:LacI family DNA-binding transcriptional regulator [Pararcticibacter amylolyticus]|uniref:Transcriptional regulator n=1 Tax=Pararcticibacter amylolyticus TaxID=2173175 RepID=A0A2U2PKU4_9SPHI|nr:LacI family DNA-binding transcriptional regulator [Pararcticibacter amylolyticus]PWG81948.1 transcriptional regulator [Pararcticibacter amylolyticus]
MKKAEERELVGVKEIARRANVSIATVDRVLHNRPGVSVKTKNLINSIIEELDYQPNIFARRLASKKVLELAVLMPHVSSETEYWDAPLKGILSAEAEIRAYGITIKQYLFDQNNRKSFTKQARLVLDSHPSGVLLAPMFIEESKKFTQDCDKMQIPYVFINSDLPEQKSLCYIGPDLYHSGYLGAHLMQYLMRDKETVLIVNISKEMDNHHHLLRKEEGFRAYYQDHNKEISILKLDIRDTDYLSVKKELTKFLAKHEVQAFFVSNSRVFSVARYLDEAGLNDKLLIGFDFLDENIGYLKKSTIDFLICQKPQEQGYRGIMALYNHLVHNASIENVYFMPIDIITKENYAFYRN